MKNNIKIIILIIALVIVGLVFLSKNKTQQNSETNTNYKGGEIFTYDILYADSPKDQAVDKGVINYSDFLNVFNSFAWDDQIRLANKIGFQSPTLSVHDQKFRQTLFISIAGDPDEKDTYSYLVGITKYTGENSKDSVEFTQTEDRSKVMSLIEKFFSRSSDVDSFLKSIN